MTGSRVRMTGAILLALPLLCLSRVHGAPNPTDPPQFWRIEVVGAADAKPVFLCADPRLRLSFVRPMPEINGQGCTVHYPQVVKPGVFVAWCESGATRAVASSTTKGDEARDFTVATGITLRPTDPTRTQPTSDVVQTRHYHLAGACPSGWSIGDAASPGDAQAVNAVTGVKTRLPKSFAPPAG